MGKFKDLTGQTYGKLEVIKRGVNYITPSGKSQHAQWWCLCECQKGLPVEKQKQILVKAHCLTSGNTTSCGCVAKETKSQNGKKNKKYNIYDLTKEYGVCYTSKNEKILFDLEDYDKIKDYCWYINCKGYAYACEIGNSKKHVFMHNVVMDNTNREYIIDHIFHNKNGENSSCDNRKSNLRRTTQCKNCINKKMQKNNTSGVVGVRMRKDSGKWIADINIDKQHIYLGQYNTFDEAVIARKEAESKYHKEYKPKML